MTLKTKATLLFSLSPGMGFLYFRRMRAALAWNAVYGSFLMSLIIFAEYFSHLFFGTLFGFYAFLIVGFSLCVWIWVYAGRFAKRENYLEEQKSRSSFKAYFMMSLTLFLFLNTGVVISILASYNKNYGLFIVKGSDMAPALQPGDVIMTSKSHYRAGGPNRGDIAIVFPTEDRLTYAIKRVMAIPGDKIEFKAGYQLFVNDQLAKEYFTSTGAKANIQMKIQPALPEDCFFVVGDNIMRSKNDSLDKGCFPKSSFLARLEYFFFSREFKKVGAP